MGLDAVELVMDVEDHFGITVTDAEAEQVITVGDFVDLIHSRLAAATAYPCPTLVAFLSLRRLVRDVANDDTYSIRPGDQLVSRLPTVERRSLWVRLPDLLGTAPPSLRRPRPVRAALVVTSLLVVTLSLTPAVIDVEILPLTLFLSVVVIWILHAVTSPFRSDPPVGWRTFGDVTRRIAGTVVACTKLELREKSEILEELRPIIVEQCGVDPDEVVPGARFIQDLGLG